MYLKFDIGGICGSLVLLCNIMCTQDHVVFQYFRGKRIIGIIRIRVPVPTCTFHARIVYLYTCTNMYHR